MAQTRDFELTFAGAGTQEIQADNARFLRVLSAPSAAVFLTIGGSELQRAQGQSINDPEGLGRIRVRSTVAQTVRINVSQVRQDDNAQELTANVTATVAAADTLTSTPDVSVLGTTTAQVIAGRADRLSVTIKNLNGNASLIRVGDSLVGAARGHELMPGESITLNNTAAVYVYNSDAGAQSVSILEDRDV